MDKFLDRFDSRDRGFARGVSKFNFPQSQYLLNNVQLPIQEIEGLWNIAIGEEEDGWCVSAKNCQYTGGKSWYKKAIQDNGLEKLSQANNNTTFSDGDENYKINKEMKDAWNDLLFQIPGFEEALFKLVSARRAYDKLPVSEQSHEHIYFLQDREATICINQIAKDVDQKLCEFTEDPRVLESDSLYLPLLSMLGLQVTVIKEPEQHQNKDLVHEQIAKIQSQIALLQQQLAELQLLE
jgi:hypothetical protein